MSERQGDLDLLRGSALWGILVVNFPFFAHAFYQDPLARAVSPLDFAAIWLNAFAFEGKFYLLFAFLFGYSFALLMASQQARPQPAPRGWYLRRLSGLGLIGLLHASLLFVGDILVSYALLGSLLWLLRKTRTQRLLQAAVAALGLAVAGRLILALVSGLDSPADQALLMQLHHQATAAYLGSPLQALMQRGQDLVVFYLLTPLFNWPSMVAMALLGICAQRERSLDVLRALPARRLLPLAAVAGAGNALYACDHVYVLSQADRMLIWAQEALTAPLLTLCYVWALLQWRQSSWLRTSLMACGRMSLTIYVAQGLLGSLLFANWGLRAFGTLSPLACLLCPILLQSLLLICTQAWLRHWRMGPDEWLLRSWTYLAWQPFRRRPETTFRGIAHLTDEAV